MARAVKPLKTRYRLIDYAERGDLRYALVEVTRRGELEVVHHVVVVSFEPILLTGRCIRGLYATRWSRFKRKASDPLTWMSSLADAASVFEKVVRRNAKPPKPSKNPLKLSKKSWGRR